MKFIKFRKFKVKKPKMTTIGRVMAFQKRDSPIKLRKILPVDRGRVWVR